MLKKPNNLIKDIKQRPSDMLALGRTIMANERTLLSFVTTSIGLLASGIGFIKLLDHPVLTAIGWALIPLSGVFLMWGIIRYRSVNKLMRDAHSVLKSNLEDED